MNTLLYLALLASTFLNLYKTPNGQLALRTSLADSQLGKTIEGMEIL